jgi:hypothetical protein
MDTITETTTQINEQLGEAERGIRAALAALQEAQALAGENELWNIENTLDAYTIPHLNEWIGWSESNYQRGSLASLRRELTEAQKGHCQTCRHCHAITTPPGPGGVEDGVECTSEGMASNDPNWAEELTDVGSVNYFNTKAMPEAYPCTWWESK